jgi:hypothetical protein
MFRLSTPSAELTQEAILNAITRLKQNDDLTVSFTRSTADEEQLTKRLNAAKEAFARL